MSALLLCQKALPLQFGNLAHEALYLLILGDRLAHQVLRRLGNAGLAYLAGVAVHQIHRPVPFAVGAMAIWFTALAGAVGQRAAKKPRGGGELGDAGTQTALGSGKFGASEKGGHILYQYYTRFAKETRAETQCEYARESQTG